MARATGKHVPMRRCVICRASLPKAELVRLVRAPGGGFELDTTGRAGGRGTWVCRTCASDPAERQLRQAFRGHAADVRALLARHMEGEAPPSGGSDPRSRLRDGGMDVR